MQRSGKRPPLSRFRRAQGALICQASQQRRWRYRQLVVIIFELSHATFCKEKPLFDVPLNLYQCGVWTARCNLNHRHCTEYSRLHEFFFPSEQDP